MTAQIFEVGNESALDVRISSGKLTILDGPPGEIGVEVTGNAKDLRVEQRGSTVWIATEKRTGWLGSSTYITVTAPNDVIIDANVASADIECGTTPLRLTVNTASGDVRFKDTGELIVKTASGDVHGHSVSGRLTFASASGNLHVETINNRSELSTASGDIRVAHADGTMRTSTMSGDVMIGHFAGREFRAKSMSGNVEIGVPSGTEVSLDASTLSGDIHLPQSQTEVEPTRSAEISVKLVSGNLRLRRV